MTVLHVLWLPILVSSVFTFVASSIIHMALPWHKSDYKKLPEQDKVMDVLRPFAIPPGDYFVPLASGMAEMRTPEFAERLDKGPVIVMTVMPNGRFDMKRNLGLWFLYLVVVNYFAAYVACHALPGSPGSHGIIRFAGVTAFLGYAVALWQMSIWYRRSCLATFKTTVDGLIYAGLTAVTFAWLWPR
jgi:hypothetical protein